MNNIEQNTPLEIISEKAKGIISQSKKDLSDNLGDDVEKKIDIQELILLLKEILGQTIGRENDGLRTKHKLQVIEELLGVSIGDISIENGMITINSKGGNALSSLIYKGDAIQGLGKFCYNDNDIYLGYFMIMTYILSEQKKEFTINSKRNKIGYYEKMLSRLQNSGLVESFEKDRNNVFTVTLTDSMMQ